MAAGAPGPHSWLAEEPTPPCHPPHPSPLLQPHLVTWVTPLQEPELAAKASGQRAEVGTPREGRGHSHCRVTAEETLVEGSGVVAPACGALKADPRGPTPTSTSAQSSDSLPQSRFPP